MLDDPPTFDSVKMVPWHVTQSALTAMNFITAFLVTVPLYWHLEGKTTYVHSPYSLANIICSAVNVGCILLIFWVGTSCLISGVNCVIWRDNAINWSPIWGDISAFATLVRDSKF